VTTVRQTNDFRIWLASLRDSRAKQKIAVRIQRMAFGNLCDVAPVAAGVSELRIHYGPGYRIYFVKAGSEIVVLLIGGSKKSQKSDIAIAKRMARKLEN